MSVQTFIITTGSGERGALFLKRLDNGRLQLTRKGVGRSGVDAVITLSADELRAIAEAAAS